MTDSTTIILRSEGIRANLIRVLSALKIDDDEPCWRIVIDKEVLLKTELQRGYFFGVVLLRFAADYGEHPRLFYEKLLEWYAPCKYYLGMSGKEERVITRVSEMSIKEMAEFIDRCIIEAAGIGCVIPPPDPFYWEKSN